MKSFHRTICRNLIFTWSTTKCRKTLLFSQKTIPSHMETKIKEVKWLAVIMQAWYMEQIHKDGSNSRFCHRKAYLSAQPSPIMAPWTKINTGFILGYMDRIITNLQVTNEWESIQDQRIDHQIEKIIIIKKCKIIRLIDHLIVLLTWID